MTLRSVTVLSAAELDESDFRDLQQQLRPPADAPWRTIPWKITLIEAQRVAIQEKKPIWPSLCSKNFGLTALKSLPPVSLQEKKKGYSEPRHGQRIKVFWTELRFWASSITSAAWTGFLKQEQM